ncbi:hypothetical protein ACOMHN_058631 [Nucella lapillus]
MIAKWCHLQELFSLETSGWSIRAAPKLKECHFTLPRGKKMKVILACQIFSHLVAAALKLYVSKSLMSEAALQTACFVETVNSMWDFVDSHSLSASVGKKPVTRSDFKGDQVRFASFSNFVESWCFTNPKNDKLASNSPSHKRWLLVLSAMKGLSQKLIMEEEVLTHLCLRKCNQDHVENLHSQIRGYNGFNDHPTLPAYVNALRCLSCSSATSELLDKTISAGANCQPDGEHGHHRIVNPCTADVECDAENADHADPIETNSFSCENNLFSSSFTYSEMELPPVESDIVQYIAGAVVRKFKQKNDCPLCVEKFTISANEATGETPSLVSLVSLKEFKLGCLVLRAGESWDNLPKASKFVEQLWLSPAASEAQRESQFLAMRDVARERRQQGWLKEAARTLNALQLRELRPGAPRSWRPITRTFVSSPGLLRHPPLPAHTTPLPAHTTPLPAYTTPLPAHTTPLPAYTTPLPAHTTPLPVHNTPLPVHTTPLPVHNTPLPVHNTHLPVHNTPLPVHTTPLPVHNTPLPVHNTPLPVHNTPLPPHNASLPNASLPRASLLPSSPGQS